MQKGLYKVEQTKKTPLIIFDQQQGYLEIRGSSLPGESYLFFEELFQLVDTYLEKPLDKTQIVFQMEYFNTSSSMVFLRLFKKFESLISSHKTVEFKWFFDEDDSEMYEAGQTYKSSIKIPMSLIPIALE
jgi:hypothetical protein